MSSTLGGTEPIESHVEDLLARLSPILGKVRVLSEANGVVLICAAYRYSEEDFNPGLYLRPPAPNAISALGAAFSYEAYLLVGEE